MTAYEMSGGDHGNYTIFPIGKTAFSAVAYLRRNARGGGYTLTRRDKGAAVHIAHMPVNNAAAELMALLDLSTKGDK